MRLKKRVERLEKEASILKENLERRTRLRKVDRYPALFLEPSFYRYECSIKDVLLKLLDYFDLEIREGNLEIALVKKKIKGKKKTGRR